MAGGGLEVWPEPIVEAISDIMEYERGGEPCPRTSPLRAAPLRSDARSGSIHAPPEPELAGRTSTPGG